MTTRGIKNFSIWDEYSGDPLSKQQRKEKERESERRRLQRKATGGALGQDQSSKYLFGDIQGRKLSELEQYRVDKSRLKADEKKFGDLLEEAQDVLKKEAQDLPSVGREVEELVEQMTEETWKLSDRRRKTKALTEEKRKHKLVEGLLLSRKLQLKSWNRRVK